MCLILVDCENVSNSFEVNCSLLSEMICWVTYAVKQVLQHCNSFCLLEYPWPILNF